MNWRSLVLWCRLIINWVADNIEHATLCLVTHGHANWRTRSSHRVTALQAVRARKSDRSDCLFIQMLSNLKDCLCLAVVQLKCIVNCRQSTVELYVNDDADDLYNFSCILSHHFLLHVQLSVR